MAETEIPDVRQSIIPEWADKTAGQVVNMFRVGDTAFIDRELLHGAVAAALVQERERCAKVADKKALDLKRNDLSARLHNAHSEAEGYAYASDRCAEVASSIRSGAQHE